MRGLDAGDIDDYINNITERLSLYNKLSGLTTEEELNQFENELIDRFGALPKQARDLLNSIRIKWIAIAIGLERVVMKKKKLVGYFISDQQSDFYQSEVFTKVLKFVQDHPEMVSMMEKNTRNGLRLIVSFNSISSINDALRTMTLFSK